MNDEYDDPIIAEVRKNREELFKKYDCDPRKMFEAFKKQQIENEKLGFKYVHFLPKRISKDTGTR